MRDSATPGGAAGLSSGYCLTMREFSRLTVLSGPSGVGKSTVVAELRRCHPELWLSVSVTTRRPGPVKSTAASTSSWTSPSSTG